MAFLMPERGEAMPRKPKRPCRYSGCPKLTDGYYCDEHQKLMDRQYDKYCRPAEAKKRYGCQWRKIRAAALAREPFCLECRKAGRITKATEVHHAVPLDHGGTNEDSNLIPLCKPCHSRITVEMGDRWHKSK